jgi:hypothetical protein
MKKLLLLLVMLFASTVTFSQVLNQPSQFNNVCDDNNDGMALFYMQEISFEIIGNNTNLVVTHHETATDAQIGANPLPNTYINISNPQTIYVRVVNTVTSEVQFTTYTLNVNPLPNAQNIAYTFCDTDTNVDDGITIVDLNLISNQILQSAQGSPNTMGVTYFQTLSNAQAQINPIINPSYVASNNQILYYNVQNYLTGCTNTATTILIIASCANSCAPPVTFVAQSITENTVTLAWTNSSTTQSSIFITPAGSPGPTNSNTAYYAQSSPYTITGLNCGTQYDVYIRTFCNSANLSTWVQTTFSTIACTLQAGQPINLSSCLNNGQACFNLQDNDNLIYGNLNQADYNITYHLSQVNANNNVNALTSPYCTSNSQQVIYARLENNTTQTYQIMPFALITQTFSNSVVTLGNMTQCDDNNDGVVTFNLTTIQAQINTTNTLEYYPSLANAQNQVVPFTNPSVLNIGVQNPITSVFVREIVSNSCDNIYTFQAITYANCNVAYTCGEANSLCNSLGVPFANTINIQSSGAASCLNTTPNPTWFYLPVSVSGMINLQISQGNNAPNYNNQDVDYIIYGPFMNPVTPCTSGQLLNNVVGCSYSAAAVENATIANAIAGQYYLVMVTNYSNQSGLITIVQTNSGQGTIDCSGLRLNAFLDANGNGSQDNGEQNFPLGQFTYETNNNGNVHNIIAPTGVYNIYDTNAVNSYDVSYAIDPNYAASYGITTASYSNLHVVIGAGMQTYNFPITVTQAYNDLAVSIVPVNAPRPGFTHNNNIVYTNFGNQTIASGTVTFNKDALVTITGNTQLGTTNTAGGFTYNFTNLVPFESRTMTVTMQVPNVPSVTLGGLLTNTASIVPVVDDIVLANNNSSLSQVIIGSYDPNDKMESHGERILFSSFTPNDYLIYTIRFENTGTASAINVRVNDVLDAKLDETSIRMISASHPYIMDRTGNNLNWRFDNIQLPVSIAETNTGKGYVTFSVKPKPGYAVGDIIPNTSSIYFDFNPAIITNTFNTQFIAQLSVNQFENGDFIFYPNPVSDVVTVSLKNNTNSISNIAVYDVLGKLIFTLKPTSAIATETIDLSSVSKGLYLLEVTTDTNLKVVKKLMVK